ncbi:MULTISPECIES: peptide deformylase [Clostridium]|uniref:Peptide deformylase n=3 Tax=Clostridium TaxID=1485 RepID=D8GRX1_CLOLD|nr:MULTISPECIES: peptide deformylase [Clostridium]ADK14324.1 N-formylmethionyl-tRNA deformylase [Clostridium ljungdahlii DSM 13528]AGY77541.1 peptide deformylase [Clostridium autoethanogenum DSM 10061]ALU37682.1 Peptide deformylase [Clostridium autoethanogenum DSM 10061]OAA88255.1 Peptide deformylase [Clostridium ljungdahlii DSM 13528]OAA94345.1 Peptide deformylase [Clostridium coskatii]
MALRTVRKYGDSILRKKSRKVEEINERIHVLLDDMEETLYEEDGVGLAAPQVGVLKRVIVIDVGEGILKLVNPEITYSEGKAVDIEGCLSIPGSEGEVERPKKVKVKALNEKGEEIVIEGEDLLARALCHEIDHLNGILFIDKIIKKGEVTK